MTAPATLPDRDRLLKLIVELAVAREYGSPRGGEADWYIDMRLTLHHEGAPGWWALAAADRRPALRRRRRADPGRRPGGDGDAARGRGRRGVPGRLRGPQGGQGAWAAAARIEVPTPRAAPSWSWRTCPPPRGSPLTAAEALQEAGAEVIGVAVIVDRGARAAVGPPASSTGPPTSCRTSGSPDTAVDVFRAGVRRTVPDRAGTGRPAGCQPRVPPWTREPREAPARRHRWGRRRHVRGRAGPRVARGRRPGDRRPRAGPRRLPPPAASPTGSATW